MPFWDDPRIEPKRAYRFLVPFRVYLPKDARPGRPTRLSTWAKCGIDLIDKNVSKYGTNNVFWFMAQSVTKPGFSTTIARTDHVVNGYNLQRRNQPLIWNFEPISLQLIDTYDHDIEMSVTALMFALGGVQPASKDKLSHDVNFAGSMVPIDNGTPGEFAIYELLAGAYSSAGGRASSVAHMAGRTRGVDPSSFVGPGGEETGGAAITTNWARKLVLKNPYLTSADFGSLDYSSNAFSSVSLQIAYDAYDIVEIVDRHNFDPSQFSARSMREMRKQQRAARKEQRQSHGPVGLLERSSVTGMGPAQRIQQMNQLRDLQRQDRQGLRQEIRSGGIITGWTQE